MRRSTPFASHSRRMSRPRREQPIGVPIHVISRGVKGSPIFRKAQSKQYLLALLDDIVERYSWTVLDWVVMTNHFHLVVELEAPTLSDGMERLVGMHARRWNWSEAERGHVYMGRYRSIIVDSAAYLASLVRYVDLNPVRAGLCSHPADYLWSGYAGNAGLRPPESFHHAGLGRRAVSRNDDVETARARYRRFVTVKFPTWARAGHEFEERPPLVDILRPGRVESWSEATDLWWYTTGDIARFYGVSVQSVRDWLKYGKPPKPFPLYRRLP